MALQGESKKKGSDLVTNEHGHYWTFLSNHGHVLLCLASDPSQRMRDVAEAVGITERAVHNILCDLETGGMVTKHRQGRRNHYEINLDLPLRHPLEAHCTLRDLLHQILTASRETEQDDASRFSRGPKTGEHSGETRDS